MPKFSVTFVHNRKKQKLGRNGEALIQARFSYNNRSRFLSTGIYTKEGEWNKKKSEVKSRIDTKVLNDALSAIARRATTFFHKEISKGNTFTLDSLMRHMKKEDGEDFVMFCTSELERQDLEESTKKQDRIFIKYLSEYQGQIPFDHVTRDFAKGFEKFMKGRESVRTGQPLKQSYINTMLTKFRKYAGEAHSIGKINRDPFYRWGFKSQQSEKFALTMEEVKAFWLVDLSHRRPEVDVQRRIFVFRVFTGLSYADSLELRVRHVIKDGEDWRIENRRKKTAKKSPIKYVVPLSLFGGAAKELIKPFLRGKLPHAKVFPPLNNKDLNIRVKQIAKLAGIEDWKSVTTHTARHTFKDLCSRKGIREEMISMMMGHKRETITSGYGTGSTYDDLKNEIKRVG